MGRRNRAGGAFLGRGRAAGRCLAFEPLESRAMLAITVNTLVDEADGSIVDGDISLRDAIAAAPSGETINFAAALTSGGPATINLALALKELDITKSLTITGPGANLLTINAVTADPNPNTFGNGSRVFNVDDAISSRSTVLIEGLTLTGADSNGYGGAIRSVESLTVQNIVFRQNSAFNGGAVGATGTLLVSNCEFFENRASLGGGAIQISASALTAEINNSTIRNNTTPGAGAGIYITPNRLNGVKIQSTLIQANTAGTFGGGIVSESALALIDSSIVGNHANGNGGGLVADHSGIVLTQVTISGNTADAGGGGIYASQSLEIKHSTIADNTANADGNVQPTAVGGGIQYVHATNPLNVNFKVVLRHTILADNTAKNIQGTDEVAQDLSSGGPGSEGNYYQFDGSLVEAFYGFNPSLVVQPGSPNVFDVDARLAVLANNGGPALPGTKALLTHALLPGSPAINAGSPTAVAGVGTVPQFDARGTTFGRVQNGRIDIGAIEFPTSNVSGDYNRNGKVDAADYTRWRDTLGSSTVLAADGSGPTPGTPNGVIDTADYDFWKSNFGDVTGAGSASADGGGSSQATSRWLAGEQVVDAATDSSELDLGRRAVGSQLVASSDARDAALLSCIVLESDGNSNDEEFESLDIAISMPDTNSGAAVDGIFDLLGQGF